MHKEKQVNQLKQPPIKMELNDIIIDTGWGKCNLEEDMKNFKTIPDIYSNQRNQCSGNSKANKIEKETKNTDDSEDLSSKKQKDMTSFLITGVQGMNIF